MPTPIWPESLPQLPLLEGFSTSPQDSVIRGKMDGYTKQRTRFTAAMLEVNEVYLMSREQYQTFRDFHNNTLKNGGREFIKRDPETGIDQFYRFSGKYVPSFNGIQYKVKLPLEQIP